MNRHHDAAPETATADAGEPLHAGTDSPAGDTTGHAAGHAAGDEPPAAGAADRLTGGKAKKPRASRAKPKADAATPPQANDDGFPGGPGNRDDSAERDMGLRTADMGESGASRKDGTPPAPVDPAAPTRAGETAAPAPGPTYPGSGPVLWEGTIGGDTIHGGAFLFRGPENEAEARDAYLRARGIRHTTGRVTVRRAD